ncbi:ATP-binding cassette domain-containing protein [Paenibacillus sp. HW567]|uniref:ATP-binding cassette domain-containing protein n=1 Tax=Paenibacillus sp. HW567 TaxID=1034769 RepID=UPI0003808FB0|nr:ABC transporter ATP-binding protein [Paenibacillus sp. HW567]
MQKEPILKLIDVSKFFNKRMILKKINLSLYKGDSIAVVGNNGAGKSTLLNIIAGLCGVSEGQRTTNKTNGKEISVGYVHDQFPKTKLTPMEYLSYMGRIAGIPKLEVRRRVVDLSTKLHIRESLETEMMYFSKGMIQKINIIQALIKKPDILLLDEPLSGLDISSQLDFIRIVNEVKNQGVIIILTSHETFIINAIANRIINLNYGEIISEEKVIPSFYTSEDFVEIRYSHTDLKNSEMQYFFNLYEEFEGNEYRVIVENSLKDQLLLDILTKGGSIHQVNSANLLGE